MNSIQQMIDEKIIESGWMVQGVFGDKNGPPFAYTIGLNERNMPELICVGISQITAHGFFHDIVNIWMMEEKPCSPGHIYENMAPNGLQLKIGAVSSESIGEYMVQALVRADRIGMLPVTALQLVWPDVNGYWPDDPAFNPAILWSARLLA